MKRWPLLLAVVAAPAVAASDLGERLSNERYLQALRRDSRALRMRAAPSERSGPLQDLRCVFHAHSALSHDSRGTEAEIVAAAKAARVRAVFMTEHPTADGKWQTSGLRGDKQGVLLVPGAELSDGLLIWGGDRTAWTPEMKAGEVLERLQKMDATTIIAHPEMRREDARWELPPFHGMEIYNTHADAMDSGHEELMARLRTENPVKLLALLKRIREYTREAFASIFDEQAPVLARWDSLSERYFASGRRVVGIAGNDSHQNVGVSLASEGGVLLIRDLLGKEIGRVPGTGLLLLLGGPEKQTYVFDPYVVSFRYVSTHVLAPACTEESILAALRQGRAYVAFDWLGDPTGFRFSGEGGGKQAEMGDDLAAHDEPRLTVRTGMPCRLRLLRGGKEVRHAEGSELAFTVTEPGIYRAEAWVTVAGENRPWIYSNPIYVR